jgi:hypothetical protein
MSNLIARLYEGKVVQGPLRGTRAVFKVCSDLYFTKFNHMLFLNNQLVVHFIIFHNL